ncbi:MAG: UvrD-helicase domain-containing protein, partial [Burkholderiaceae bacterium]|nr:UvrD-helicase domain-containing protein [Burkholderiaceae bacterium]
MTAATPFDVFNCQLDGTSLIEASAGTGKTWNICGLYLRLLLERKLDVQQILVVTFTNAATAELRDRIRSRIAEMRDHLSGQPQAATDPFIRDLTETLENRRGIARDLLMARLELALQTFDEASIFTIHGFCQRALADSAFAAGQAFALELQPDDSDLMIEAVHDFWRQHIASNRIGMELAAYLLQKNDTPEKFAALLKRHLAKPLAQNLWPQDEAPAFDHAALAGAYAAAQANWATNRKNIVELLKSSKDLKQTSYKPASIDSAIADYDAFFSAGNPFNSGIKDNRLQLLRSSRLSVGAGTKIKGVPPQHEFFNLAETLLAERERTEQALERKRLDLIQTLLDETSQTVYQRKRERRLLSFNDILYNVHLALQGNRWLAESLRQRFPAALVDEFQDTDPLQFSVFNTIYGASKNPLFLVGDPKQAIYRFRNADLDTYLSAKQQTSAIYSISHNQRSTQGLIGALNDLFSANQQAFMLPGLDYQRVGFGSKPRKK